MVRIFHCIAKLAPIVRSKGVSLPSVSGLTQGLSLRRNFLWTLAGNTVYAGCQWGMLIILAKLGSPEVVGQFTFALAVTAPVLMLTNLQLRAVQATDARLEYHFGHYLTLRLLTIVAALLIIDGITGLGSYCWDTKLIILTVGLAKAIEAISDVYYGLFQQQERLDLFATSIIIKGIISITALAFILYLTKSLILSILGLAVAWTVTLIAYDIYHGALILADMEGKTGHISRDMFQRFLFLPLTKEVSTLSQLVRLTFPLGFVMMVISLNTNVPRYFIQYYLGERELGIYAAMAYLILAGKQVVDALGQSASPRMAKYYATGRKCEMFKLLVNLIFFGLFLGVAGVLVALTIGKEILTIVYRPDYAKHAGILVWLMVAASLSYVGSFLGYGMTAMRYFRIQSLLYIASFFFTTCASLLLVPYYGLLGAAWAVCLSYAVEIHLKAWVIIHAFKNIPANGE